MILAEKISSLRKKNGWSQEELAMRLNVSRQSVSKWESTASIPDLDKILQLSQLFGVSTDYLLKDEIEEETGDTPDTYTEEAQRSVSLEEANAFLEKNQLAAKRIAAGAAACILSPAVLILLGGLAEYGNSLISEDLAGGLGVVILLLIVCAAVAVFLFTGMKLEPYKFLEEQAFTLQYGVRGLAESRKAEFEPVHQRCTVAGVSLCISSVIPLLISAAFQAGDLAYIVMVDVLLLLVACGAALLIWTGTVRGGYEKLLQEGEYTPEKKAENKRNAPLAGIYWCLITAVFLGVSFYTMRWDRTWIIWPCAGVLFAAFLGIANFLRKKK